LASVNNTASERITKKKPAENPRPSTSRCAPRRADAGCEQDREQGAYGDEAAAQHGEHQDLQQRQPLQPPDALVGHLGDDMLGAEVLPGWATGVGRPALLGLGHRPLFPCVRDAAGEATTLPSAGAPATPVVSGG
jgi:hypothetical protein